MSMCFVSRQGSIVGSFSTLISVKGLMGVKSVLAQYDQGVTVNGEEVSVEAYFGKKQDLVRSFPL